MSVPNSCEERTMKNKTMEKIQDIVTTVMLVPDYVRQCTIKIIK